MSQDTITKFWMTIQLGKWNKAKSVAKQDLILYSKIFVG